MSEEEMFKGVEEFDASQYDDEVKRRWGQTDAYRISAKRTKGYTKADWAAMAAASGDIEARLAAAMDAGRGAADPEVQAQVQRWQDHITKWFYPCADAMLAGLGEMYVDDERFKARYDAIRPGLAVFLRDAIRVKTGGVEGGCAG